VVSNLVRSPAIQIYREIPPTEHRATQSSVISREAPAAAEPNGEARQRLHLLLLMFYRGDSHRSGSCEQLTPVIGASDMSWQRDLQKARS